MEARILIDGSPLGGEISGAGRYAYKLIDELIHLTDCYKLHIVVPPHEECNWDLTDWKVSPHIELVESDISGAGMKRQIYYIHNTFDYDLFHSLSSYLPLGICGPSVVTIHDLKHIHNKRFLQGLGRVKRTYVYLMLWNSILRSEAVITVSDNTKSDISDTFRIPNKKIFSVPLGPGEVKSNIDVDSPINDPYLLFVGELRPHKNVSNLIKAYNSLRTETGTDIHLVIAGEKYRNYNPIAELNSDYEDEVHILGRVDDETLAALYRDALAFVFPSLYEGFGLPVLEAMGYGVPVVVSNRTSVPEVVGDSGLYFDPENIDDIQQSLKTIIESEDKREELRKMSRSRFSEFSWKRTAKCTLDVYQRILDEN